MQRKTHKQSGSRWPAAVSPLDCHCCSAHANMTTAMHLLVQCCQPHSERHSHKCTPISHTVTIIHRYNSRFDATRWHRHSRERRQRGVGLQRLAQCHRPLGPDIVENKAGKQRNSTTGGSQCECVSGHAEKNAQAKRVTMASGRLAP